jgi:hypothetical protein
MFAHLSVLISVILGLALTHLLRGLSKLIQQRTTVKIYWVHVVWTINLIAYVLAVWWGMANWNKLQTWTTELFFFLSLYSIVIFMLSSQLFPAEFPADMDFERYYFANNRWIFGMMTVSLLIDVPETIWKQVNHLRDVPSEYVYFLPALLGIAIISMLSKNRHVHAILSLVWLAMHAGYLSLTALEKAIAG